MPTRRYRCSVCHLPETNRPVVHLRWEPRGHDTVMRPTEEPRVGDATICTECIRGIKRLPFTAILDAEVPF